MTINICSSHQFVPNASREWPRVYFHFSEIAVFFNLPVIQHHRLQLYFSLSHHPHNTNLFFIYFILILLMTDRDKMLRRLCRALPRIGLQADGHQWERRSFFYLTVHRVLAQWCMLTDILAHACQHPFPEFVFLYCSFTTVLKNKLLFPMKCSFLCIGYPIIKYS